MNGGIMRRNSDALEQYASEAKDALRSALWKRGMNYRELALLLTGNGVPITRDSLANKVGRGSFSAGFYFMCLALLKQRDADLD